jgi:hypothetical protein
MSEKLRATVILLVAIPVLGILMGGIYSLPAMRATDCREPWYTLLLAGGLSVTVVAIGITWGLSLALILIALACAWSVLLVRRSFGKLDHNVERFGLIHAVTLAGMVWLILFAD